MTKYPLFIFHTNRGDLTEKAYLSVCEHFNVTIIDNSGTNEIINSFPYVAHVYVPPIPFNFQQSHNLILKWAQQNNYPWYFWMHNDAQSVGDTAQRLIEYVEGLTDKWGTVFTYYDCFCAFNTEAMTTVNGWSVLFPQYFGDCHLYRKLRLAGYPTLDTGFPCSHYNGTDASATIKGDNKRKLYNAITFPMYDHLYNLCWNGSAGNEKYQSPFNKGDLTI